jgi:hypothetical protein
MGEKWIKAYCAYGNFVIDRFTPFRVSDAPFMGEKWIKACCGACKIHQTTSVSDSPFMGEKWIKAYFA